MIDEILNDVRAMPTDLQGIAADIAVPEISDISLDVAVKSEAQDIFSAHKHQSWDKSVEARCDFTYKLMMKRRGDTNFISIWKKSIYGRTLTDIKSDDEMVQYFASAMVDVIRQTLGFCLADGDWAVVTTPMRRHRECNFASRIAERIARELHVPFYYDCAHCHSRHRVDAVFTPNNIPQERNVIVFDDFVTSGSTIKAMRIMLEKEHKNTLFFCGINNKL